MLIFKFDILLYQQKYHYFYICMIYATLCCLMLSDAVRPTDARFDQFNGINVAGRNYINVDANVSFINTTKSVPSLMQF